MPNLKDAYAIGAYIEGAEAFPERWKAAALAFRQQLGDRAEVGVRYGPSERMVFDIFHPQQAAKGTLIFVHGGYWRAFDCSFWSHLAAGAVAQGWAVAIPSYDLCPEIRIAGITQQIAQAVQVIAERSTGPLSLAGHSAGGHLVARMCAPGMLPEAVFARLIHVLPISPIGDLEPLLHTAMNDDFKMDTSQARAESPLLQPAPDVPVTVLVGANERPALLDQAMWLANAWGCPEIIADNKHHFDVIDMLCDPDGDMVKRLTGLK